jgi:agmatine deiminase
MGGFAADGRDVIAPYLNLYLCNGAAIVPVSGEDPDLDAAALAALGAALPDREIVPVAMRAAPMQGGAVHCMTQQIPHDPDDPRAASLAPRTAEEAPC